MGLLEWVLAPVEQIFDGLQEKFAYKIETDVTLKSPLTKVENPTKVFRPETFDDYIGQDKGKVFSKIISEP